MSQIPTRSGQDAGRQVAGGSACEIAYRPYAGAQRWLSDRFRQTSHLKTVFTMVALVFFVCGVGALVYVFASAIWSALGAQAISAAEYAARKAANEFIIACFSLLGTGALGLAAVGYLSQPTHLRISGKGVEFLCRRGPFSFRGAAISWEKVSAVTLQRRLGEASSLENYLCFKEGSKDRVKVKLAAIGSMDEKSALSRCIETWAPEAVIDAGVLESLLPPVDHAYTELWLQAFSAPPRHESLRPLMEGSVLAQGKYLVEGRLGVGGQGTAYLAKSLQSGSQLVVLKEFIFPVYVDIDVRRQALRSFENEARILQQLDHRQVVSLLEFFVEDQRGYLVLEYIQGVTLKGKVDEHGPLSESSVKTLALQMCSILGYLHGLTPAVLHRDFTPDNLILSTDGSLKLVDFNVALQTDSKAATSVVGKHSYLPPEQFRGLPTPQSDIYAMGGSLFFLLTGQDPEPICANHPSFLKEAISERMNAIVARATAVDLSSRYKSARELEADLRELAEDG